MNDDAKKLAGFTIIGCLIGIFATCMALRDTTRIEPLPKQQVPPEGTVLMRYVGREWLSKDGISFLKLSDEEWAKLTNACPNRLTNTPYGPTIVFDQGAMIRADEAQFNNLKHQSNTIVRTNPVWFSKP